MSRLTTLLVLLLGSACTLQPPTIKQATPIPPVSQSATCQLAANGGPILGERGIGGTGSKSGAATLAERGIGGTGIALEIPTSVVRGLTEPGRSTIQPTGTANADVGIVGVITGFHGVCIDGTAIDLDGTVPIRIDGVPGQGTELRAGQVAIVNATSEDGTLRSLQLAVRHEVSGPIEEQNGETLTVAGQRVIVSATAWQTRPLDVGDWVTVSGLHQTDGSILATRLDPIAKGLVSIHGRIETDRGKIRISRTILVPPPGSRVSKGSFVWVIGQYNHGVIKVQKYEEDLLAQDPVRFFGGAVRRITDRTIVKGVQGGVQINGAISEPLTPSIKIGSGTITDAVITLERGTDGAFMVMGVDPVPDSLLR